MFTRILISAFFSSLFGPAKVCLAASGLCQMSRHLHPLISVIEGCDVFVYPQVSLVLSALQAGNKGTQACITAASAVSGIIADLDTTIMFASAGTLNAENEESFADHR